MHATGKLDVPQYMPEVALQVCTLSGRGLVGTPAGRSFSSQRGSPSLWNVLLLLASLSKNNANF